MRKYLPLLLTLSFVPAALAQTPPAASCDPTQTVLIAKMATHTMPPVPTAAPPANERGATTVKVLIGTDGVPTDTSVDKSSGSPVLDEAAVDYVKRVWRWEPPIRNCAPAALSTLIGITWGSKDKDSAPPSAVNLYQPSLAEYPPDSLARKEEGVSAFAVTISASGVTSLKLLRSSGFPGLDDKAVEVLLQHHQWAPAQFDGHAIATIVQMAVQWKLPKTAP